MGKDITKEKIMLGGERVNISALARQYNCCWETIDRRFFYIKNEYRIKLGNFYNYIDLLLFNIKYNCYVVVELKVTELKKEHIGQIEVYMNYIDKNVKSINHNKTIGIIIVKENNKFVIKYRTDERISAREYELV